MNENYQIQQYESSNDGKQSDLGYHLLEQRKWDDAVKYFEKEPQPISYFYQSFALKQLNSQNRAQQLINKALQQNKNLYDDILKQQEEKLSQNPNNVMAQVFKVIALIELNKKQEAEVVLQKLVELDPEFPYIYVLKSNNLWQLNKGNEEKKQLTEEIELIDIAIKKNENLSIAYLNKGAFLSQKKQYNEAIEQYDKALTIDPTFSEAYFNKGLSLIDCGRFEEAIECFKNVIEFDKNFKEAYQNMGDCLMGLFKFDEAIEYFDQAIQIDKGDKDVYFCKAKCLQKQEIYLRAKNQKDENNLTKFDEINNLYIRALQIDNNFLEAIKNQGVLLDTHKEPLQALNIFNYAYYLEPNDSGTSLYIGQQLSKFSLLRHSIQSIRLSQLLNPLETRGDQQILNQLYSQI